MDNLSALPGSINNLCLADSTMVLLVDDQVMVAEALRRILETEPDLDYHYCEDPALALKAAEQIKPSVILLDLEMPEIDGLAVLRYLRSNPLTENIPVVVLSTKEAPAKKAEAFAAGANDYLIKWPDRIELLARIRYHSTWFTTLLQRDEGFRALRVSQRKLTESNLHLQRIASLDGLTGIPNRRYFDTCFDQEWHRAAREKAWLSLVMLDIDHFKKYNDQYGHLAGDECLKTIANAIATTMERPADIVARYGGEEFVLVLPGTNLTGAEIVAEKVRKAIEALRIPHLSSDTGKYVTVSLGLATTVPSNDAQPLSLLSEADSALYAAKEAGRNQCISAALMKT